MQAVTNMGNRIALDDGVVRKGKVDPVASPLNGIAGNEMTCGIPKVDTIPTPVLWIRNRTEFTAGRIACFHARNNGVSDGLVRGTVTQNEVVRNAAIVGFPHID